LPLKRQFSKKLFVAAIILLCRHGRAPEMNNTILHFSVQENRNAVATQVAVVEEIRGSASSWGRLM
jgi:hypothetical protein